VTEKEKKETINSWINLYTSDLFSWALYKVSSKETTEDLVQDTFVAAFSGLEKFKNNSSPKSWLFSILNNKIVDHYRKTKNQTIHFQDIGEQLAIENANSFFSTDEYWVEKINSSTWNEKENVLDNLEFQKVLNNCLEKLPAKWKDIMVYKFLIEKDSKEICKDFELTSSNYWQIIHRSKLLLKNCIQKNWSL
jgi:RNA polymerase sigma-70 factor (TIGR02943 family)